MLAQTTSQTTQFYSPNISSNKTLHLPTTATDHITTTTCSTLHPVSFMVSHNSLSQM